CATGAPHLLQNRESGGSSVPHDPHKSPAAVSAPRPSPAPSTSVSCHRWSAIDRHIAVLFPRRSFETLICRRFRGISLDFSRGRFGSDGAGAGRLMGLI